MTNKIMELADEYARYSHDDLGFPQLPKSSRAALATEVQAQQDYTRAVIAERDALKAELKKEEDAHDADVNDLNYYLRNSITNHKQVEDELDALRKAAQMALEAIEKPYPGLRSGLVYFQNYQQSQTEALAALRKELGQ